MNNSIKEQRPLGPTLRAYLQLVRAPNLFTAAADVVMGFLVVRGAWQTGDAGSLGLLVAASVLLYAGGVVLNDVFDLPVDRRERPERPIPSGRVSPEAARRLGWGLLLAGIVAAGLAAMLVGHAGPGVVALLLAGCIVAYDARLKRAPLGPAAMGACRALNVLLGMSVAADAWQGGYALVVGGIGGYVAAVTWFARTEARRSRRPNLAAAAAVMVVGIVLLAAYPAAAGRDAAGRWPPFWFPMILLVAAPIVWRCGRAVIDPSPGRVQVAVKWCILWLVVLDAAVAYAAAGPEWAIAVALLLAPAVALGRWVRMT